MTAGRWPKYVLDAAPLLELLGDVALEIAEAEAKAKAAYKNPARSDTGSSMGSNDAPITGETSELENIGAISDEKKLIVRTVNEVFATGYFGIAETASAANIVLKRHGLKIGYRTVQQALEDAKYDALVPVHIRRECARLLKIRREVMKARGGSGQ